MQQDHTLALANIATATQADRTSVALLTKMILELSIQVAHLTAKIATSQAENYGIKKIGTSINHSRARTSGVQKLDPVGSNLKPRSRCILQKRTDV